MASGGVRRFEKDLGRGPGQVTAGTGTDQHAVIGPRVPGRPSHLCCALSSWPRTLVLRHVDHDLMRKFTSLFAELDQRLDELGVSEGQPDHPRCPARSS